jgi:hypothetical protein
MRQGAKLMFASGVLLPIFFGLCFPADSPGPLLVPLAVFLAGLFRTLYCRLFYEDYAPAAPTPSAYFASSRQPAVPPGAYRAPIQSPDSPRSTTNPLSPPGDSPHAIRSLEPSPRRKGMRQGAKIMFISGVLLPIFFGLCFPADSPGPLLVPLTVFFAGLVRLLYSQLFSEDSALVTIQEANLHQPASLPSTYRPPAQSLGAPPGDPANQLYPPSVLEHTTRNLEPAPRQNPGAHQ